MTTFARALLEHLGPEDLAELADRLEVLPRGTGAYPIDQPAVVTVPLLMSVANAAAVLGCSPRTVRRRIAEGSLPAVTDHGRVVVRGDDLRKYIDDLERVGAPPARRSRAAATGRFDWLRDST